MWRLRQLGLDQRRRLPHCRRVDTIELRDPPGHLDPELAGKLRHDARRVLGPHVRQQDGHRLRLLLGEDGDHLARIGMRQHRQWADGALGLELVEHLVGPRLPQPLLQELAGQRDTALVHQGGLVDPGHQLGQDLDHGVGVERRAGWRPRW